MARRNAVTYHMSDSELKEFIIKCKESEEFFYENYIRKLPANSRLPKYSKDNYKRYLDEVEKKREMIDRRHKSTNVTFFTKKDFLSQYPKTASEVFKK